MGPSPTGGPFGAWEGATRGTGAPAAPGAKAPGLAAGRDWLVNDLITSLGRWSCDQPSLAPPPPRSAPLWGYKTAPCPWCFLHQLAWGLDPQWLVAERGVLGGNPEGGLESLGWAGFLGEDGAGAGGCV